VNDLGDIIAQLERQREAIDRALEALRGIEGTAPVAKKRGRPPGKKGGGKRSMSAEGRARIAEATRKRWAEKRAAEAQAPDKGTGKARGGKRRMSAEGRARIAEATRKRWAEKRAAEAQAPNKETGKKRAGGKKLP
jgi:hypothetical protein